MEGEKLWYVVNAYSGHEQKVKENLESRTETMGMENNIFRVVVPEKVEVEVKDGVKKEKVRKMFPGYVLIEMIMSDEAWYVVRNTPGVTGFIGSSGKGAKPIPLSPEEVKRFIGDSDVKNTTLNTDIEVGDSVSIIDGPFKGMYGKVESEDKENEKLTVLIDLFGQETPVEVDLIQVARV
ncbi:MAG: transcription termination/antitermination protein NusG [Bacilli bacterium]|nr:transcription termination/antitermination protein NusG [Bacilli bacterium]